MFCNERPFIGSAGWYWQTDARYRFIHVFGSPIGRTALGRQPWELAGVDTRHPDWATQFDALMARRPFENLVWRRVDGAGRLHQCIVSGEPMFGPKGRFLGFRGVGHDASEAIEAERALVRDLGEVLASLRQQADRARAHLPASSPARPLIDEMDQAGQRARTLCGLIHDLLLPPAAPDTAHRFA